MIHAACVLVIALALAILPASSDAAVLSTSTFNTGTEGWQAFTNGPGFPTVPVIFSPAGGNPGGALRHNAPSDNLTSSFLAPSGVVNALHSAIGGSIAWDISTLSSPGDILFSDIDLGVRAGDLRIRQFLTPPAPATNPAYTHYDVDFSAAAGWDFFDGVTTSIATQAQIDTVLAGATVLFIRAEYFSSTLPDVGFLDNVIIESASATVPFPSTLLLLGAGVGLAWLASRRMVRMS
jgi:hypothetical protein